MGAFRRESRGRLSGGEAAENRGRETEVFEDPREGDMRVTGKYETRPPLARSPTGQHPAADREYTSEDVPQREPVRAGAGPIKFTLATAQIVACGWDRNIWAGRQGRSDGRNRGHCAR